MTADRPRSTMGNDVQEKATQAQEKAEQVAGQAKQQAKDLAHQAEEQAKSALSSRKAQAATGLNDVAQAFRQTSNELNNQDKGMVAQYSNQVADRVEQLSTYLENKDVEEMIADAEDFARRQPELFIGGALVLGFLGARFLRSSNTRRQSGQWSDTEWRRYPDTEPVMRNRVESNW